MGIGTTVGLIGALGTKTEQELARVKSDLQAFETVTFCDKKTANLVNGKMVRATNSNIGQNWEDCLENNSSSWYLENAIDLTGYIGKTIRLTTNGYAGTSVRAMGFCDDDGKISSVTMEKDIVWTESSGKYYHDFTITDTHFFFSFSQQGTNTPWQITIFGAVDNFKAKVLDTTYSKEQIDEKTQSGKVLYVSLSGADTNPGTQAEPLATINKALELGANVILLSNHTFKQQIDMSKLQSTTLEIAPIDPTFKPIIMEPSSTLATSETALDGYTKVKKVTYSGTFATGNNTIFQHGVPDALTSITDAERHPLQRGKEYRCEDTTIKQCSADNLSDALTEIENANTNVFKFYHDKPNNTLYFSRPQTINSTNPLCFSRGNSAFTNIGRNKTVKITGITFKYIICDVRYMVNPKLIDCAVMNVFGDGGFLYDQAVNAEFIRCEATRVFKSGNGDGFNAHSLTTGEAFAKQTTATLIDCWAHDNNDDGWSAHERSETTIIGGLYENNTKGGIVPSYGAHCTCHGVYARKNSYNFYFTGENTQAEGGKYGQLICYDCVAEANSYSQGAGFGVNGAGNKMILVNCKAIGNRYAYFANTNTIMDLIDCKSGSNVTAETNGTGTFNVKL